MKGVQRMNKIGAKKLVAGLIVISLLSTVAFASTGAKTLSATYNDIKIAVDGKVVTPKDANGKVVEPFVVNGTTYLPVRAVAEALGKTVSWDGKSQTATISTPNAVTGKQVFDDEFVSIRFVGCRIDEGYSKKEYVAVYNVTNKTDYELTFQCGALSFNGVSYNKLSGSDEVAPNSTGNIEFSSYYDAIPTSGITKTSGSIKVIDFSYTLFKSAHEVKFVDITA